MAAGAGDGDPAGIGNGYVSACDEDTVSFFPGCSDAPGIGNRAAVAADGYAFAVLAGCDDLSLVVDMIVLSGQDDTDGIFTLGLDDMGIGDGNVIVETQYAETD